MDGLWKALRQEGFTRLATKLAAVRMTRDPVRYLTALGAAYLSNALERPDHYRVMFDAGFELEDAEAADDALHCLVQSWTIGHGLASLVATGPLPHQALAHAVPMLTALYVSAGDDPDRCRLSVERGWGRTPPL
ncbi:MULTISPECIES: TetR-like C-terminal domain-containing protein [unclassified Streptomyces]|uniref:TetR-like C-terminal domain-containing protein n=1 Tax=unclassified Streptomyces TaxID=2593676 RepID=UPI00203631E7|nr:MULTISPECIES: TetR-like C-terminal domain-containing protein [unclassified Streptomyces]